MKHSKARSCVFLFLCLLGCLPLRMTAQSTTTSLPTTLEGWADRLTRFGKGIPQEKVFVHMDNTCYFLGDTIWYAAYTRRTDKDVPSGISRVLYAELYNQDGYLVERQLVRMQDGRGSGCFALPDTLYGGYYELRAYTRWQLNWGQTQHPHTKYAEEWFFNKAMAREYYRDYDKLYSRVFPVYDKPKQPGEFFHDMTMRPLRRNYKEDHEGEEILISFFPEGGRLVGGAECRMAFEAADDRGMWMEGKLEILENNTIKKVRNERGEEADFVTTIHRGRGLLTFTPQAGERYEALFTAADGRTAKAVINRVPSDGVALQVDRQGEDYIIKVRAQGEAATKPLGLSVMYEGVVEKVETIDPGALFNCKLSARPSGTLDTSRTLDSTLSPGVHQVTVFDADGRVWADRLFFVTSPTLTQPALTVTGMKEHYEPFESAELQVTAPSLSSPLFEKEGSGVSLSLSVRDAATQDYLYDSGNILTEMLLASEIKGFVPQPEYFFEKDDEEHRTALDLLMMTQGWRRFDWHTMATPGVFAITHPAETQTPFLSGVVHKYMAQQKDDVIRDQDLADHQRFMEGDAGDPFGEREEEETSDEGGFSNDETFQQLVESTRKDIIRETKYKANGQLASNRFLEDEGHLKREVRVHAEFAQDGSESLIGDADTKNGRFRIQAPIFEGYCVFFLAASDTTKWKDGREPLWVVMDEEQYPEYYVRLSFPYPRFVKPYTFYQTQQAPAPEGVVQDVDFRADNATLMQTVTVQGKRRRGLRRFDPSKPAFIIDAYQAFNEVADAGLSVAWYQGYKHFIDDVARTYIGDMNMERAYEIESRFNTKNSSHYHTPTFLNAFNKLCNLDSIVVYTDYAPRREGLRAFRQDNQPTVTVDLRRMPNEGQRVTYRDRRYILQGFNVAEDFYHPNYRLNPPKEGQQDFRRTLYWNPNLQLDANGQATVRFFTGSRPATLSITANGQASDGTLLTN
ncbi:MAG: hypothetical protein J5545_05695 [Bacteroidaceae bacterium]|nr:hypothetical protein [Bacteroidaceae bacterium]